MLKEIVGGGIPTPYYVPWGVEEKARLACLKRDIVPNKDMAVLKATVKTTSNEEKDNCICKLRQDSCNLEIECGDGNTKDDDEQEDAF